MIDIVPRVNALALRSSPHDEISIFVKALPVVTVTWDTLGSNLRSMTLDLHLEAMRHALSPAPVLPNLENLAVRLPSPPYSSPAGPDSTLVDVLAPFVNQHRLTLQSFGLSTASKHPLDISSFLLQLQHFPVLQSFALSVYANTQLMDTSGLQCILGTHAYAEKALPRPQMAALHAP